jgi:pyridoxine 5-phosphate synthase
MLRLGLNVDHAATIRNARMASFPDPVKVAEIALAHGADGITAHLREDQRHIRTEDMYRLRHELNTRLNMEMANTEEMVTLALKLKPDMCTLVPERRQELTTEGGLDVVTQQLALQRSVQQLQDAGILVSLFIDPDDEQLKATHKTGAQYIEFHTGRYANLFETGKYQAELSRLFEAAEQAHQLGIQVNAGHGLTYDNVPPLLLMPHLDELNIGHFLLAQSIYDGIGPSVKKMKAILNSQF